MIFIPEALMDFMQHLPVSMSHLSVSVVRKVDSAIHWIVIFSTAKERHKKQ